MPLTVPAEKALTDITTSIPASSQTCCLDESAKIEDIGNSKPVKLIVDIDGVQHTLFTYTTGVAGAPNQWNIYARLRVKEGPIPPIEE